MKLRVLIVLCALAAACFTFGQTVDQERSKKSAEILSKMRQVDILNQLLPIILTKEEIKQILPAIERAQDNVRKVELQEAKDLAAEEKALDEEVAAALDRGEMPKKEYLAHAMKLVQAFQLRRQIAGGENINDVFDACSKALNAGQMKVIANSLDPRYLGTSMKREQMTDDQLAKLFVKEVLLDPIAYGLLVKMSK